MPPRQSRALLTVPVENDEIVCHYITVADDYNYWAEFIDTCGKYSGQLYEVLFDVQAFDSDDVAKGLVTGSYLEAGTFLMFLGEAREIDTYRPVRNPYSVPVQEKGALIKFLSLKDRKIMWLSTQWLHLDCLKLIPCDD